MGAGEKGCMVRGHEQNPGWMHRGHWSKKMYHVDRLLSLSCLSCGFIVDLREEQDTKKCPSSVA
jgi:hypothetical protein